MNAEQLEELRAERDMLRVLIAWLCWWDKNKVPIADIAAHLGMQPDWRGGYESGLATLAMCAAEHGKEQVRRRIAQAEGPST